MIGVKSGKRTVIAEGEPYWDKSGGRNRLGCFRSTWLVRCECGQEKTILKKDFTKKSKSCLACSTKIRGTGSRQGDKRGTTYHERMLAQPKGKSGCDYLFSRYKATSKKKGLSWLLSRSEFEILTSANCHYCDESPSKEISVLCINQAVTKHATYFYNGIDRKDNNRGYELDNVLPCCTTCNMMKRDLTYEEFVSQVKKIAIKVA